MQTKKLTILFTAMLVVAFATSCANKKADEEDGEENIGGADIIYLSGSSKNEIWFTDGKEKKEKLFESKTSIEGDVVKMGEKFYFGGEDDKGSTLFESDGTKDGTKAVIADRTAAPNKGKKLKVKNIFATTDTLYFSGDLDGAGETLWESNGKTAAGIKEFNKNIKKIDEIVEINGKNYVLANGKTQIWKLDATVTTAIKDFGTNNTISEIAFVGDVVYVVVNGILWSIDKNNASNQIPGATKVERLINFKGTLYFFANNTSNSHGTELQKYTGTKVEEVHDIYTGTKDSTENCGSAVGKGSKMIVKGDFFYFAANGHRRSYGPNNPEKSTNEDRGCELWRSNGTEISLVRDINRTGTSSVASDGKPANFVVAGEKLFFSADSGSKERTNVKYSGKGEELWVSDGAEGEDGKQNDNGTNMVKDINSGTNSSEINNMFVAGSDYVFFIANDGSTKGLWKHKEKTTKNVFTDGNIDRILWHAPVK